MPIMLNPKHTFDYVLKDDRELDEDAVGAITFNLRVLTVGELAKVEDALAAYNTDDDSVQIKSGSQVLTILKLGLAGWNGAVELDEEATEIAQRAHNLNVADAGSDAVEGPVDPVYKPVVFKMRPAKGKAEQAGNTDREVPTNATLDRIDPKHRRELAEAITERNRLTSGEKGN